MLNILLIADIVSKIISLVIFVCLAMWSIRNLKVHDVSCASATLHLVIITTVSKGLLYSTGGPAERSIIRSIIGVADEVLQMHTKRRELLDSLLTTLRDKRISLAILFSILYPQ